MPRGPPAGCARVLVQGQAALFDQLKGGDRGQRLGHGGDPEQGVAGHGRGVGDAALDEGPGVLLPLRQLRRRHEPRRDAGGVRGVQNVIDRLDRHAVPSPCGLSDPAWAKAAQAATRISRLALGRARRLLRHQAGVRPPAAAERAEGGHRSQVRAGARLDQLVRSAEQFAVGVAHLDQAADAALVGLLGLAARRAQLGDLALQGAGARLRLRQVGEGVFHLLGRAQHGGAVAGQGLGPAAPRAGHLGVDPAEVEEAPAQPRADLVLNGVAGEDLARVDALRSPQQARDRDLG